MSVTPAELPDGAFRVCPYEGLRARQFRPMLSTEHDPQENNVIVRVLLRQRDRQMCARHCFSRGPSGSRSC